MKPSFLVAFIISTSFLTACAGTKMKNLTSFITISISILLLFHSACAPVINTTKNNLNENTPIESIVEDSYPNLEADLVKANNFKAYKSDIYFS